MSNPRYNCLPVANDQALIEVMLKVSFYPLHPLPQVINLFKMYFVKKNQTIFPIIPRLLKNLCIIFSFDFVKFIVRTLCSLLISVLQMT